MKNLNIQMIYLNRFMNFYYKLLLCCIILIGLNEIVVASNIISEEEQVLTKVYYEYGKQYYGQNQNQKAKSFLEKSIQEGDDQFSKNALLLLLKIRAEQNEQGLEDDLEFIREEYKAEGYYFAGLGYLNSNFDKARDTLLYLSNNFTQSIYCKKSFLQISLLELRLKRYSLALDAILSYFSIKKITKDDDSAWFTLAVILEKSKKYYSPLRAYKAYKKVLKYPKSEYYDNASNRIQYLEKNFSF